jgi:hypothetical protein
MDSRLVIAACSFALGCSSTPTNRDHALERVGRAELGGLRVDAAFALPSELVVEPYGGRRSGRFLVFGASRRPAHLAATTRAMPGRTLAVVDIETGELVAIPAVHRGWDVSAVAGAADTVIVREKHGAPGCVGDASCVSWALYAYRLPDPTPLLLAASTTPASQFDVPEPQQGDGVYVWLERTAAGDFTIRRWTPSEEAPRDIGRVPAAEHSPYISVAADRVVLDTRDRDDGPSSLRLQSADGIAQASVRFTRNAYFPVAHGERVAFATTESEDSTVLGDVAVGHVDARAGTVVTDAILADSADPMDLAFLDDEHVVVPHGDRVQVFAMQHPEHAVGEIADSLAASAHACDGSLVVITREGTAPEVVWALSATSATKQEIQ